LYIGYIDVAPVGWAQALSGTDARILPVRTAAGLIQVITVRQTHWLWTRISHTKRLNLKS